MGDDNSPSRSEVLNKTESDQFTRVKESSVERRGFVKGALTSIASITGISAMSGVGSAETDGPFTSLKKRKAIRPYKSVTAVENVLSSNEDLLEKVAEDTSLSSGTADAFNVDGLTSPGVDNKDSVTFSTKEVDGEHVAEVRVMKEVEEGYLTVAFLPDIEERYALLNSEELDEPIQFESIETEGMCGGCPDNKCCELKHYCCGSTCPSCTCFQCSKNVCNCCDCGWNCAGQCV